MNKKYNRFFPYKILAYPDRLQAIADGKIPYPVIMHIYPTNFCNNNCTFCIMKEEKQNYPVQLSKRTLFKAIRAAKRVGVKLIHFSGGGEPTLHPDIIEAMILARELEIKTAISTNGSVFLKELPRVANHIRVSINAGTNETYLNNMRPTGHNLNNVFNNIKKYVKIRNENKYECDIGTAFVMSYTNYTDIYQFCRKSNDINVDFVHIRPAFLKGEDWKIQDIMSNAFAQSELAKKEFENLDIFTITDKFEGYWTPRTYSKCRSTPLVAVLSATGEFIICQDVFKRFGNLNTHQFEEIWGNDKHKKTIESIDLSKCPRCVENGINKIIQHCFLNDDVRMDLI